MAPPMRQPAQRAGDGEAFETEPRAFGEAQRRDEILLDRIGRAGDDGGVVTEQQTAERGDDGQRDEKAGMSAAAGAWTEV